MRYEEFNPVKPREEAALRASAVRYIETMATATGTNDQITKAELLKAWYETMIPLPINPSDIHHSLYNRDPTVLSQLSLLILELEIHKIASAIAKELGIVFSERIKTGLNRSDVETNLRALLETFL